MRRARDLAGRARGAAAPNPCVGAVLVRGGEVVAEGFHTRYGLPHAEVECLADARAKGVQLADCTLFVTLEPCNHQGKTPPCTRAILEAGIPRVVVGAVDPNPDVAGGGIAFLRKSGVEVTLLDEDEPEALACRDLIADFLVWKSTRRTYNYLKLAATLDGRIATRTGHSQWISCEDSRRAVHGLRGRVQAVIVGGNTLYADDPALTCRLGTCADEDQPLAVVVTSRLPAPDADLFLLRERAQRTLFWTTREAAASARAERLEKLGVCVWGLGPRGKGLDLAEGYTRLRDEKGCLYTLCEGGGMLGLSLLRQGLADEFWLYLAPRIMADNAARPLFDGGTPETVDQALGLRIAAMEPCGEDVLLTLRPKEG